MRQALDREHLLPHSLHSRKPGTADIRWADCAAICLCSDDNVPCVLSIAFLVTLETGIAEGPVTDAALSATPAHAWCREDAKQVQFSAQ